MKDTELRDLLDTAVPRPPRTMDVDALVARGRRRQRRRMTTTAAALGSSAAVVALTLVVGVPDRGPDSVAPAGPAAQAVDPRTYLRDEDLPVPNQGVVSESEAALSGVDASLECTSPEAIAKVAGLVGGADPEFLGGYETDFRGLTAWGAWMAGGANFPTAADLAVPVPPGTHHLCWYRGDFQVAGFESGPSRAVTHVVVDLNDAPSTITMPVSSPRPIGIIPPPPPAGLEAAAVTTHPQPAGVRVLPGQSYADRTRQLPPGTVFEAPPALLCSEGQILRSGTSFPDPAAPGEDSPEDAARQRLEGEGLSSRALSPPRAYSDIPDPSAALRVVLDYDLDGQPATVYRAVAVEDQTGWKVESYSTCDTVATR